MKDCKYNNIISDVIKGVIVPDKIETIMPYYCKDWLVIGFKDLCEGFKKAGYEIKKLT